ncbi:MAG TPA: hypothetical protein VFE46_00940 [Pirellulales bacterium]|jgi:hypothetical protein|nr:hypothetical protein [Pirellulales bacterium]
MKLIRFYGHFAAAYGTIWLIFVLSALFSNHVETGEFGLYGFPAIALAYAVVRTITGSHGSARQRRVNHLENLRQP